MTRLLALCTLPRRNPGKRWQDTRVNGPYTLLMSGTGRARLPYGTLPRLLLAWVCSEAVRTQRRVLVLGASRAAFMRKLGIGRDSGGARCDLRGCVIRWIGCSMRRSRCRTTAQGMW